MAEGDSLPLFATTLLGSDGLPLDLTGCTVTMEVARIDGEDTPAVRTVTPDPDQVANPGDIVCKVFDRGESRRGDYGGMFKVIDADGEQLSVYNDRLVIIRVFRRPGA